MGSMQTKENWLPNPPAQQLTATFLVDVQSQSHAWLFETPWTAPRQAPLSMEFARQEYWSGLPIPSPGDLPDPGIKPVSLVSPALAGRFFTPEPPGKPNSNIRRCWKPLLTDHGSLSSLIDIFQCRLWHPQPAARDRDHRLANSSPQSILATHMPSPVTALSSRGQGWAASQRWARPALLMRALLYVIVSQSCPTCCDPKDYSLPGSSLHGILQAITLEWVAISFSRESSQSRDWTRVSCIPGRRFNLWATGEAPWER